MRPALSSACPSVPALCAPRVRALVRGAVLVALVALAAWPAGAQQESFRQQSSSGSCKVLVIGFVGGIGTAHFPPSVASPILHHMSSLGYPGVCTRAVSPYCLGCGSRWAKKHFSVAGSPPSPPQQIALGPKVILLGYSLGVPSELRAARALDRAGIPVELLVAVDARGFTRGIIPSNVERAANFYERELYPLYFGKRELRPENPAATQFLGNIHLVHVGHFTIVRSMAVRDLLERTVREIYEREERGERAEPADQSARGLRDFPVDVGALPMRLPRFDWR